MLTIYALANNSNSTEDVYTSTAKKQLYVKLTHNSTTLVHTTVTSLKQALKALQSYNITNVHVSYNVDCTSAICTLANKINLHFLK
jgi:hypothetical protein